MPLWSLVLAGALGLGIGISFGNGDSDGRDVDEATDRAAEVDPDDEARPVATTQQSTTTTTRSTTTTQRTTTTTPEGGTRENPFPPGTPLVTSDGVKVTVNSVNLDGGGPIAAENQFNDPAPEGARYILVNVSVENTSDEPITPWVAIKVNAIGSGSTVHDSCSQVTPEALMDAPELYPGGSASGNVCLTVPNSEVDDGSLLIMVAPMFGDPVFVLF